jgi:hypothetical protein
MKQFTIPSYTFTPGASGVGTVNLSGISGFNVKYLVAVINQTRGVVIYSTGDTATRYTNLAGTTLTLNVDTSTHNSGDVLQVIYEVTSADPLTDAQLRASAVPVSGTFFQATQPVSAASLPLPSGAATETTLAAVESDTTAIAASVASIDGKNPALVSGRVPVDGSGVTQPVSGTFWQATQPVSIASSVPVTGTFFQATQPVSAAALPLPSGASTETTLVAVEVDTSAIASSTSAINDKLAALSTRVLDNEASGAPVRAIGQEIWNVSFSQVGASVISDQFVAPQTGTGVSYSQASGALAIVAGTTANAEFFTRSTTTWRGSMRLKFSIVASQRIANNNLAVMLADLVGEGLTVTINSATSITVAQAGHAFTSTSVGQFVQVGRIVGAAGVPGRYAIASVVAGTSYNLTVAGWPASGSCTATIFGHSYVRNLVTGTTATAINVDAQRRGWAQGDTAATINTTASPGTIITCELTGREVFWADQVRATTTTPTVAVRANRVENIPDDNLNLYLFVWSFNGTTAPASSTTWTMSFCSIEKFANMPVYIQGNRAQGAMNPIPVQTQGTVATSFTQPALVAGSALIGDVGHQYRANATGAASGAHLVSAATTNATIVKGSAGRVLGWALANTNAAWRYVKLHNQTTTPTAGSGVVRTIAIPPNSLAQMKLEGGIAFATGIGLTTVTGSADADTAAVGAGDIVGELFFA